jgi:hypothetical protein
VTVSEQQGRLIVYARSQGRCEACTRPASEWHHRVNRSQGGTWSPANGLHLCNWCHGWITVNPLHAQRLGLTVPRGVEPDTRPAYLHPTMWSRGWWYLFPDGCWKWTEPPTDVLAHPEVVAAIDAFTLTRLSG